MGTKQLVSLCSYFDGVIRRDGPKARGIYIPAAYEVGIVSQHTDYMESKKLNHPRRIQKP
jgi:hypothetical protein